MKKITCNAAVPNCQTKRSDNYSCGNRRSRKTIFSECNVLLTETEKIVTLPDVAKENVVFESATETPRETKDSNEIHMNPTTLEISVDDGLPTFESTPSITTPSPVSANTIRWNDSATLCLINLIKDNKDDFKSKIVRQKSIWMKISEVMKQQGHQFTFSQCENRFKTLKRTYSDHIMIISKSGESKHFLKFENELSELFQDNADVKPKFTVSIGAASKEGEIIINEFPDLNDSFESGRSAKKQIGG